MPHAGRDAHTALEDGNPARQGSTGHGKSESRNSIAVTSVVAAESSTQKFFRVAVKSVLVLADIFYCARCGRAHASRSNFNHPKEGTKIPSIEHEPPGEEQSLLAYIDSRPAVLAELTAANLAPSQITRCDGPWPENDTRPWGRMLQFAWNARSNEGEGGGGPEQPPE